MLSITVCIFLSPHMHGGGYEGQDLLGFVKDKIANAFGYIEIVFW